MNPMYYGTLSFLAFMTPFFLVAAWLLHGRGRDAAKPPQSSSSTAAPESHSQSAE
jgi:hypothetical protein